MRIEKVAVVGAGTMGASIAVALTAGLYPVLLKDVDDKALAEGSAALNKHFEALVGRGHLGRQEADARGKLIETTTDYSSFHEVDLVIEAVPESISLKERVFRELDDSCHINAVLATNTSSLSITRIAACTRRPDKVIGLHFFNPAHRMNLIEVIPGLHTSAGTQTTALTFGRSLGKLAVLVEECPSFLVNRLLARYMNEALWCLFDGLADVEEIDQAACDFVMPVGPLALRDLNGADIGLEVASYNFAEYGERLRPPPILKALVDAGLLGRKAGKGFYIYDGKTGKRGAVNPEIERLLAGLTGEAGRAGVSETFQVERLFLPMINEAFLALQEKIVNPEDLDPAMMAGLGMRKGPLKLADEIGLSACLDKLNGLFETNGERFRPANLLKRYVWAGETSIF